MGTWQNLDRGFFDKEELDGKYDFPIIKPVYELPKVKKHIEFDYCQRVRDDKDQKAVHFFEDDYKFERCWVSPDRYAEMLKEFAYCLGPDFSVYADFPLAVQIYNHYRNHWLTRYWQEQYNMTVVPTIMWGWKDTWDWCFDGYPKDSIVAVSNVGVTKSNEDKEFFHAGYEEMLQRLQPKKILMYTRNFEPMSGNVQYIKWELHKGDQIKEEMT